MILMITLAQQEQNLILILLRQTRIFFLSLYHNGYGSYLYVNKAGTCKFKVHDNIPWYKFCLGSLSKDFIKDELSKVSLNSFIYDFSVDQSAIENEDMAYICEYLMKKKDKKECSNLLN